MKYLRICDTLNLPAAVATEKLALLGRTGSGKTYAAMKLAELLHDAGAQFVSIDPVGVWWGLRLGADGKSAALPIPVFGGLRGDVPLEPTGGKLIADLIVDRRISAVVDVSQFESDADKARFSSDFAARLFFRKKSAPSAIHIFLEEAQEFVPQNLQRGEERMVHAWQRLMRLGRNFGIGATFISQRPQDVNKKALNQAEVVFAFQLTGPQERKAVEGWTSEKGLEEDVAAILPKLEVGQAHVWSPGLLRCSKTVRILERATFNASSTPKVGARGQVRELAPIDMEELGEAMKASVEKAKAEDPKALQARIRELEAQAGKAKAADPKAFERALEEARARWAKDARALFLPVQRALSSRAELLAKRTAQLRENVDAFLEEVRQAGETWGSKSELTPREVALCATGARPPKGDFVGDRVRDRSEVTRIAPPVDSSLLRGERKMLETLARRHPGAVTRAQLGTLSGFTPSGGTFGKYFGTLRRLGLLEEQGDDLRISPAGFAHLGLTEPPPPLSRDEVLDQWRGYFLAGERKMLDVLVDVWPDAVTRAELGKRTGFEASGGTFGKYFGTLRRNGLLRVDGERVRMVDHVMEAP